MINLEKVVNDVRDRLKQEYLREPDAVWNRALIVGIRANDCVFLDGSGSAKPERIISWFKDNMHVEGIKGVCVGRMVAKYSEVVGSNGEPILIEKAILVTGRMLDTSQTLVKITRCVEHKDLRELRPGQDEPVGKLPTLAKMDSPDKSIELKTSYGRTRGFRHLRFDPDQVFDSRQGDKCEMDPIISGVINANHTEETA